MKAIILAAGQGIRMGEKTKSIPKCMLNYQSKPIIDHIINTMQLCGLKDIVIVNGYKKKTLENHINNARISFKTNKNYYKTNMVHTLFCAESEMNDDIIISYSDIIYKVDVLMKLIEDSSDFAITVDKDWRKLWEIRMENPLEDAETMILDDNGNILQLGKKPSSYAQIDGQYIGLLKISKNALNQIRSFYHNLDKKILYDGKDYYNMFMTTFIQLIIDNLFSASANIVNGGWLEFDTENDLETYNINKLIL